MRVDISISITNMFEYYCTMYTSLELELVVHSFVHSKILNSFHWIVFIRFFSSQIKTEDLGLTTDLRRVFSDAYGYIFAHYVLLDVRNSS